MMSTFLFLYVFIFVLYEIQSLQSFQFPSFTSSKYGIVKQIKNELLEVSRRTKRGLTESPADRTKIVELFEKLEKLAPTKKSLSSPKLNAIWKLEYTTSDSILGRKGYKKVGDILQLVDATNLKAKNTETIDFFGLKIPRQVTADLTPLTPSKVKVQFRVFSVGPISFKAPSSAIGELDTTYVDDDMRLSRGDKGNLFVLTKYSDLK